MVFNNFNLDLLHNDFKVNNGHLNNKGHLCTKFGFCSAKGRAALSLLSSFSFDRVANTSAIYSLGVTYLDIPKLKHVKQRLFKMLMGPKRPVDRCEAICQHKAKTTKMRHGVQMSNTFHSIFLISVLFKSYN